MGFFLLEGSGRRNSSSSWPLTQSIRTTNVIIKPHSYTLSWPRATLARVASAHTASVLFALAKVLSANCGQTQMFVRAKRRPRPTYVIQYTMRATRNRHPVQQCPVLQYWTYA